VQGEVSDGVVTLEVAAATVVREAVVTAVVLETLKMAVPVPATLATTAVPATVVTTMEMRPAPAKAVRRGAAPATAGVGVDRAEEQRSEHERDGPSIHRAPPSSDLTPEPQAPSDPGAQCTPRGEPLLEPTRTARTSMAHALKTPAPVRRDLPGRCDAPRETRDAGER
jgi:hypothetical protein